MEEGVTVVVESAEVFIGTIETSTDVSICAVVSRGMWVNGGQEQWRWGLVCRYGLGE